MWVYANDLIPMNVLFKIRKLFFVLALLPASASAAFIFTIDTFTPDELTITIVEGSTLDATGSPPTGTEAQSFWLIDPNGVNHNWIVGDPFGDIDGIGFDGAGYLNNDNVIGDGLYLMSSQSFPAGATVTPAITGTWSGSNAFDPSAVSSFLLTWGEDGILESYPFGDPQGTTSTPAVPDTGSTAALLGAGVVALAFARRRLG